MPSLTKKYLEFFISYSSKQIITSPTRTTDATATFIDHVLTSYHKVSQSGVIDVDLSDHDVIICTQKVLRPKSHKENEITVRSMSGQ